MNLDEMQAEINLVIDDIAGDILDGVSNDADKAIDKIDSLRKEYNSVLLEYANKDGAIPNHRLKSLLRELDEIERGIGESINGSLNDLVREATDNTNERLVEAAISVIGLSLIGGGKTPNKTAISKEVRDFMDEREFGGVGIGKRINSVSGLLRDTLQREIRYGAIRGDSITKISRRAKKAFDKMLWQVKRIITSEIPTAIRRTTAVIGEKLGIIQGVLIIDLPGRHAHPMRHKYHECYRLAEQDMYGWGKGVYKPTDAFIFDPHPQCSAYFHFILRKDLLRGGDD